MKKLTQNPKEQQADKLWKDFNPDKEKGFWKKYDLLLKTNKPVAAKEPGYVEPPANEFVQEYHPVTSLRSGLLFIMLTGVVVFVLVFVSIRNYSGLDLFLMCILFVAFFIFPLYYFKKIKAFAVSESGLYIFRSFLPKKKQYFTWKEIELVELVELEERIGGESEHNHKLRIDIVENEVEYLNYNLSKHNHEVFFNFMAAKNVEVECFSDYYKRFGKRFRI